VEFFFCKALGASDFRSFYTIWPSFCPMQSRRSRLAVAAMKQLPDIERRLQAVNSRLIVITPNAFHCLQRAAVTIASS